MEIIVIILLNDIFMLLTVLATIFLIKDKTPVQIIRDAKEKVKAKQEQKEALDEMSTNLYNITNYNGSEKGQKDFR
jgi:hypothetical protein